MPAVRAQLEKFPGVVSADVSMDEASAVVTVKKGVKAKDLADTVNTLGFQATVQK